MRSGPSVPPGTFYARTRGCNPLRFHGVRIAMRNQPYRRPLSSVFQYNAATGRTAHRPPVAYPSRHILLVKTPHPYAHVV